MNYTKIFNIAFVMTFFIILWSCKKVDETPPLISMQGLDTVETILNLNYTDPGITATDETDGDLSSNVAIYSDLNINKVGYYSMSFTVSDKAGNISETLNRVVHVYNQSDNLVDTTWIAHDSTLYNPSKLNEDFDIHIVIDSTINNNIIFSRLCSEKNGEIYAKVDAENVEIPQQEITYNDSLKIICQGRGILTENKLFELHYAFYTDTTAEFKSVRITREVPDEK